MRFWKDDGRSLVATSVPARKHGGVEEAFRKAVALRKRSFIHVLARVAVECQSEGRELTNLRWSRSNHHWKAEYLNEVKICSAETEDDVRSSWRTAVIWLASQGDSAAALIDIDAAERYVVSRAARMSQGGRLSTDPVIIRDGSYEEERPYGDRGSRRRKLTEMSVGETEDRSEDENVVEEHHHEAETRSRLSITHSAIQALQPLPPGLIWARTTSRFFAVFKDSTGSSSNRKKRFKTFDPKKFGGVNAAFEAASEFLETVDPWVTKSAAAAGRSVLIPRKVLAPDDHVMCSVNDYLNNEDPYECPKINDTTRMEDDGIGQKVCIPVRAFVEFHLLCLLYLSLAFRSCRRFPGDVQFIQ